MNEKYCRKMISELLTRNDEFNFYVPKESIVSARKVLNGMGLKVSREMPHNSLLYVLEVHK
jgi:hypothetical protein